MKSIADEEEIMRKLTDIIRWHEDNLTKVKACKVLLKCLKDEEVKITSKDKNEVSEFENKILWRDYLEALDNSDGE